MSAEASAEREGTGRMSRFRLRVASSEPEAAIEHQDDEVLMWLIRSGREDAFEDLYDRYSARAYRVARSVCEERGWAELAVHEAFASVWRGGANQHARRGSVAAWLLMVVKDQALTVARREYVHISGDAIFGERDVKPLGSADRTADGSEAIILAALPDAQREVIVLACYGELKLDEIAEQLALTPAVVKSRMRLGLRGLLAQSEQPTT